MDFPKELKYTKTHEWVLIRDEIAVVGITDFAQQQLTDIVYVELPEVGKEVKAGGECAVVESVKAASDIYSPLSGKIVRVNEKLNDEPQPATPEILLLGSHYLLAELSKIQLGLAKGWWL